MKYTLHENLVLTIFPETKEEQALIKLLEGMKLEVNGHGIHNAGMTYDEGKRTYLGYRFVPLDNGGDQA